MSRYLSYREIEGVAEQITGKYYQMLGISDTDKCPIDPILLAEEVLQLRVTFLPLCSDGSILGMAAFDEMELTMILSNGEEKTYIIKDGDILVDSALQREKKIGRCNFTIAHETGHHILNRMFHQEYNRLGTRRSHIKFRKETEARSRSEWQADALASALLMPKVLIQETLVSFGLGERIEMLNRLYRPKIYQQFSEMSEYLGVSKQALSIRLSQLGYLDRQKNYLANPYELLQVYCDDRECQLI